MLPPTPSPVPAHECCSARRLAGRPPPRSDAWASAAASRTAATIAFGCGDPHERGVGRVHRRPEWVLTGGLPAARYSSVLSGNEARLKGVSRYGVTPTSMCRAEDGSDSNGCRPTQSHVGPLGQRREPGRLPAGRRAGPTSSSDTPSSAGGQQLKSVRSENWRDLHPPTGPAEGFRRLGGSPGVRGAPRCAPVRGRRGRARREARSSALCQYQSKRPPRPGRRCPAPGGATVLGTRAASCPIGSGARGIVVRAVEHFGHPGSPASQDVDEVAGDHRDRPPVEVAQRPAGLQRIRAAVLTLM